MRKAAFLNRRFQVMSVFFTIDTYFGACVLPTILVITQSSVTVYAEIFSMFDWPVHISMTFRLLN